MPELTRPTSITVTAEELWTIAVIPAPSISPFVGLEVIVFRIFSSFPPAIFSKPDDII